MTQSSQFGTVREARSKRRSPPRTRRTTKENGLQRHAMLLQRGRLRRLLATAADVITLQLAIEGGAADAEHLAGQSLVSIDLRKDTLDGGALDIFQIGGAKLGGAAGEFGRIEWLGLDFRTRNRRRQIVDFDDALIAESNGSLQAIFQFANIAGPVI